MNRDLVLAVLGGAVVCTFGDYLHATHDVLSYPHESMGPEAWWVPPLFAGASIAALLGANQTRRLLGGEAPPVLSARRIGADALFFFTAYAFTSFAHPLGSVVLAVLVAFWAARMLAGEPRWLVVFSLAMAGAGTAFEAIWSALGFFAYHHPDFGGVPRWLPAIYLHAAPLAARLGAVVIREPTKS